MKSKTKIGKQLQKKLNPSIVETILAAKKHENWRKVAGILSGPRRKFVEFNLQDIDRSAKEGESVLVPGKVLSQGNLDKKIKVIALNFSSKAKEKLFKSKNESVTIIEEIKKNPEAKGLRILVKGEKGK
jgi:large subunit ribosomal protein L18e|tara:strand:- start:250 stop:636 length:387 start_codon:yes stop_codon:yes gene_type:complete